MTFWPIEDGRGVSVPGVGRIAVIPLTGSRPALGPPPSFDAMDPGDVDMFVYDWSGIAFPGDAIITASITCTPPLLTIGTPVISGTLVQAFIGPATGPSGTYDLNCAVSFATGRVLDWGCEIAVRPL